MRRSLSTSISGASQPMPDADAPLLMGIELGGTKAIASVARGREILSIDRRSTTSPEETLSGIGDRLSEWVGSYGMPEAIGVASFGPIGVDRSRADYGTILRTPKPGWSNTDVVGYFEARFEVPIGFDTDVAGAALAEYQWGAGQGCEVLVYITIGTGIGAGILVEGRPVHGLVHPEFGHIRVRRTRGDSFAGICPFHGDCLEGLASGPAIASRAGFPGETLSDDHPAIRYAVNDVAEALAQLLLTISPQRVLIGGGVVEARPTIFPLLRQKVAHLLADYLPSTAEIGSGQIIRAPALGAMAGPLGALALGMRAIGRTNVVRAG